MRGATRRTATRAAAVGLAVSLLSCGGPSDYVYFGSVRIADRAGFSVGDQGQACGGTGAFADVQRGAEVFVLDERGRPLSKDFLSEGRHNLGSGCVFRFGLARGRSGAPRPERLPPRPRYRVRVANHPPIPVEFNQLRPHAYQLRFEVVLGR